jgi:hypothetical protein
VNHYTVTRPAEMRLQETARQARIAWWRGGRPALENDPATSRSRLLDWSAPVSARIAGA